MIQYLIAVTFIFILLSVILKWNIWNSRLQTPYFLAMAPVIGYVLQGKKIRWLAVLLWICLLLNSNYYIFGNVKKPFFWYRKYFYTVTP